MSVSLLKKQLVCLLVVLLVLPATQVVTAQAAPQNGSPTATAPAPAAAGSNDAAPAQESQPPAKRPVGTAVAPYEKASGVTATRPAGAVIAPAKQRRVKAIFIKIAVVVAAGAAIGAVAALSRSSPSQPH